MESNLDVEKTKLINGSDCNRLASYSSDLNPIENLWAVMNRMTIGK